VERVSGRLIAWASLVGALSLLLYVQRFSGEKPPRNAIYQWSTAVSELVLFGFILGIVLLIARGLPLRQTFALRPPSSWRRAAAIAAGVFIGIDVLTAVLTPLLHPGAEQGLAPKAWQPAHAGAFALNALALALVGPIVEELTFRGLGFRLLERYGRTSAIVGIGIAFGLWHGLIEAFPVLAAFGVGLAYLRARTGSLYPCIALHALFNGVALAVAVAA
jgi:membrane protease YdiL (CAAX protease family)